MSLTPRVCFSEADAQKSRQTLQKAAKVTETGSLAAANCPSQSRRGAEASSGEEKTKKRQTDVPERTPSRAEPTKKMSDCKNLALQLVGETGGKKKKLSAASAPSFYFIYELQAKTLLYIINSVPLLWLPPPLPPMFLLLLKPRWQRRRMSSAV